MVDQDSVADFQRSTRMPLDAVVRLHFEGTVAYQNGFAANVSASGMYVKHPEPPPVGTRLVFEFAIGAQRRPVQGAGEVVWSRDKYEGPGRPAGAGIRFVELDALSRQHLTEALFEFLEASLGDRVIESPEARALVDSVPSHVPPESFTPQAEPTPAPLPAPLPESLAPAPLLPSIEEGNGEPTPFRIFDEEATPFVPAAPAPFATPIPEIPEEAYGEESHFGYGAASARPEGSGRRRGWLLAGGVALLAAAGFAVWWFLVRPTPAAPAVASAAPKAAAAVQTPAPPPSPPLAAQVEPGRTLAESVGDAVAAPDAQLPPVAATAAEPVAAPATPVVLPAAATVIDISAAPSERTTVVTIAGDGAFATGSFAYSEIGGEKPRVLIKLKGIGQAYRAAARGVPTAEVQAVRTGFHSEFRPSELHVVLDLVPGARAMVASVEPVGEFLVVTLRRP